MTSKKTADGPAHITPEDVQRVARTGQPSQHGTYELTIEHLMGRVPYAWGDGHQGVWDDDFLELRPNAAEAIADAINRARPWDTDGEQPFHTELVDVIDWFLTPEDDEAPAVADDDTQVLEPVR
jgi:hypothetical protein